MNAVQIQMYSYAHVAKNVFEWYRTNNCNAEDVQRVHAELRMV